MVRSGRDIGAAPVVRVASVSPAPRAAPSRNSEAILFADDFDAPGDLRARYFEYDDAGGSFVRDPDGGYGGRGAAMRCRFDRGQVSAGNLKVLLGRNPLGRGIRSGETFREIYWRVYVRHEPGWQGNPAKLARATCLAGRDWSQGLIAHVWGGKNDALCIDPATGITDNRKITTRYNDFAHLRWLGLRNGTTPIFHPAESGRWVCVESRVRLNTPGRRDGILALWVDGRLEAERADLDWHGTWDEYAINAVFLENYWNDGSPRRQARWFDRFVISTRPIRPIVAADPPALTRTMTDVSAWQAQVAADAEGRAIVWTSKPAPAAATTLTVEKGRLASGRTHWLRVREQRGSNAWSAWTPWHAPFRAA